MFKNRYKSIRTPLNSQARDVTKTVGRWSQRYKVLKKSISEIGAKDKNSKDNEWEGEAPWIRIIMY
jgi:hypothetical protein